MRNQGRFANNSIGKRALALFLALITTITSWSLDWSALRVQAADNSSELTVAEQLSSGGAMEMTYTNSNYARVSLSRLYFKFYGKADVTYSYTVSMVQSGSTTVYSQPAVTLTGSDAVETVRVTPESEYVTGSATGIYLDSMDTLTVTVTLAAGDGEQIEYYTASNGDAFAVMVAEESESGDYTDDMPQARVTITNDAIITSGDVSYLNLAVGDSVQLGYTIDYARAVSFSPESDTDVITVTPAGLVTAATTGTATVVAKTAQTNDIKGELVIQVLDVSLNETEYTYTGSAIEPTDFTISGVSGSASDLFTIGYNNNTNVGTATVTLTGKGVYTGYQKTLSYTINQRDISGLSAYFTPNDPASYSITTSNSAVTITNVVDVANGSIPLTQGTDFTATAELVDKTVDVNGSTLNYKYNVFITGIGNYKGTLEIDGVEWIESAGLQIGDYFTYELSKDTLTYNGSIRTPKVTIRDKDGNAVNQSKFIINYSPSNPTEPGTVNVTVTSTVYEGSLTGLSYKIVQNIDEYSDSISVSLDTSTESGYLSTYNNIDSYLYTGNAIEPAVTVTNGTTTLVQGTDYTVSYSNNTGSATAPATAMVAIKGMGYYSGTVYRSFRIVPSLKNASIIFGEDEANPANSTNSFYSNYSETYTGSSIKPSVEVYFDDDYYNVIDNTLTTYGANTDVSKGGEVTIYTKANSMFGVQHITAYFNIDAQSLSGGEFELGEQDTLTYNGEAQELSPKTDTTDGYVVKNKAGKQLTQGIDYTVGYSNNKNASDGGAIITATGMGNYTGTLSNSFSINAYDIADSSVTVSVTDASYTGMAVEPAVTVKVELSDGSTMKLTQNTDFTVSYSNNIKIGDKTGVATIKGMQNFRNSRTENFSIVARSLIASSMTYTFGNTDTFVGTGGTESLSFATTYETEWSGWVKRPAIEIWDGSTELKNNIDYTVEFDNNKDVTTDSVNIATATVTGKGNYEGSATVTFKFTITKCPIDADCLERSWKETPNGENPIEVTIEYPKAASSYTTLVEGTDFTVAYDTTPGGGKKTATITGTGKHYTGSYTLSYTVGDDLSNISVSVADPNGGKGTSVGDGTASNPKRIFFIGENRPYISVSGYTYKDAEGNVLSNYINEIDPAGTDDFSVEYTVTTVAADDENGYAAGSYVTATVSATENTTKYYGSKSVYYYISPAKILTAAKDGYEATIKDNTKKDYLILIDKTSDSDGEYAIYSSSDTVYTYSYLYSADDINPQMTLYYKPWEAGYTTYALDDSYVYTMVEGTDYTIKPSDVTLPGTVGAKKTFTITGAGNFDGSVDIVFSVAKRDLTNGGAIADIDDQTYEGEAIFPEPVVTYGSTTLTKVDDEGNGDYTVVYEANNAPGTWTITVKGANNYSGELTKTFNIVKTELNSSNTTVTIDTKKPYKAAAYTVSDILENLTVVYTDSTGASTTLSYADKDFSLTIADSTYPGDATVTVTAGDNLKYSVSSSAAPSGTFPIYLDLTDYNYYKITGIQNENARNYSSGGYTSNGLYLYSPKSTKWYFYTDESKELTSDGVQIVLLTGDDSHTVAKDSSGNAVTLVKDTNFIESWYGMKVPGNSGRIVLSADDIDAYHCWGSVSLAATIYGNLAEATVDVAKNQEYTGNPVTPEVTVTFAGQTVSPDYYTETYQNPNNNDHTNVYIDETGSGANKRTVVITAKNDEGVYYSGTNSSAYFYILYNLSNASVTGINSSYKYDYLTGNGKPTPTVKINGTALEPSKHYTVTYNPTNGIASANGTVTVSINSVDNVSYGSVTRSYTVEGTTLTDSTVTCDALDSVTYTYNGKAKEPKPVNVQYSGTPLKEGTDYYLTYENNVSAGNSAAVIINGKGNYSGSVRKTFTIKKKSITPDDSGVVLSGTTTYYYAGGTTAVEPTDITLYDQDREVTLYLGEDFTIDGWKNNKSVTSGATAPVEVTMINTNYEGTHTYYYTIAALDLSSSSIDIEADEVTYNGSDYLSSIANELTITVETGDDTVNLSSDYYKVTAYSSSGSAVNKLVNAGTYTLLIEPSNSAASAGTITGSARTTFTINPKKLTKNTVGVVYTYYKADDDDEPRTSDYNGTISFDYTGSARVMSKIAVTDSALETQLKSGTDYTVGYAYNTDSGAVGDTNAPSVTISGTGNYTGDLVKEFNIGTDITGTLQVTTDYTNPYTYNGKSQHPAVTVKIKNEDGDYEILSSDYYTISYIDQDTEADDDVHAGTKVVTVKGANGYYGTVESDAYVINPKNADTAYDEARTLTFALEYTSTNYTGSALEPTVTAYDTAISRTTPIDADYAYSVSYNNNTDAGTAIVNITTKGDYSNKNISLKFTIKPIDFDSTTAVSVNYASASYPYFTYIGNEIKPSVTVTQTIGGSQYTLIENTDYVLSYKENIAPGDATITITGNKNFNSESTFNTTFRIKADLSNAFGINSVTGKANEAMAYPQFYSGVSIDPTVYAQIEGISLTQGEIGDDCDFYTQTVGVDEYTGTQGCVDIVGNSKYYTGTGRVWFDLSDDVEELLHIEGLDDVVYMGSAQKISEFEVLDGNGVSIAYDADSVTYTSSSDGDSCINVGTVTVTIPVTVNNRTFTMTEAYDITQAPITDATLTYSSSVTYTGKAEGANPLLTYNGKTLTEGTDYTVSYSNNVYPSQTSVSNNNRAASFTITGKGNFKDTVTKEYLVSVQAMRNVTAEASGNNAMVLTWDKKNYVTGYRLDVIDSTNTPIGSYLISDKNKTSYTVSGLTSGASYSFRLMGYVDTNNDRYLGPLTSVTAVTTMVAPTISVASNRAGTATITVPAAADGAAYLIYRSTSQNGTYTPIVKLITNQTSFTDTGRTSGETYYYRACAVRSVNGTIVYGEFSEVAPVTIK